MRYYGRFEKVPEDPERCIAQTTGRNPPTVQQCRYPRLEGGLCWFHRYRKRRKLPIVIPEDEEDSRPCQTRPKST